MMSIIILILEYLLNILEQEDIILLLLLHTYITERLWHPYYNRYMRALRNKFKLHHNKKTIIKRSHKQLSRRHSLHLNIDDIYLKTGLYEGICFSLK